MIIFVFLRYLIGWENQMISARLACYHFTKNVFLFSFQQHPGAFSTPGAISSVSTEYARKAGEPSLRQTRGGRAHNCCCLQASGVHQRYQVTELAAAKPSRYAKEIASFVLSLSVIMKMILG